VSLNMLEREDLNQSNQSSKVVRARKIVFVSPVFPLPADSGKKMTLKGFVEFFTATAGTDQFTYVKLGAAPVNPAPFRVINLALDSAGRRLFGVITDALLGRKKSLQEAFLYGPNLRDRLNAVIEELDPDVVILDTIRVAQFFDRRQPEGSTRRWVLYLEDLFSERYASLQLGMRKGLPVVNPLGAFAYAIPAPLRVLVRLRWVQAWLLEFERQRVSEREGYFAKRFPDLCLVNPDEVAALARAVPTARVRETPPCVRLPETVRTRDAAASELYVILGALDYLPNAMAVRNFLNLVMPEIESKLPNARIKVVGRGASFELQKTITRWKQCELLGYVEDLDSLFASATAMLVPIEIGSGIKLKTLEALAHGLPLITTRNGIEGIPAEDGVHCLVSSELTRFPEMMEKLTKPSLNQELSTNGRNLYEKRYARDAAWALYVDAFLNLQDSEGCKPESD